MNNPRDLATIFIASHPVGFQAVEKINNKRNPHLHLLADWNSYAATSNSNESSTGLASIGSFDLEAAVRSANDTVSGTFNV
ncbi:hypothetical protein OIU76_025866 [Salix suchowensis]|nr:hypothetical protein OIU76_025866 [Salix suchowensis]